MQAIRTVLFFGIFMLCSTFQLAWSSEGSTSVLPSFVVDATEGLQGSGFIVHFTNTSVGIDESCGTPVSYAWTIDNGVEGIDWNYVEGTGATTVDLAVEFFIEGCYNVILTGTDCAGVNFSQPEEITVAGDPELFYTNYSSDGTCTNGEAQIAFEIAPHNNNNLNLSVYVDGAPYGEIYSYQTFLFCIDPSNFLFSNTIIIEGLTPGQHQIILFLEGDVSPNPVTILENINVYEAPELTLSSSNFSFCSDEEAFVNATIENGLGPYLAEWYINGILQYSEAVNGNSSSYTYDLDSFDGAANISVTISDSNGCSTSEGINIEVYPDVVIDVTTTATCSDDVAVFTASGNATQYVWPTTIFNVNNPVLAVGGMDTQSAMMANTTSVDVLGQAVYTGTLDGVLVCSSQASANAIVFPSPVLSVSPPSGTSFCEDDEPEITVTGANIYSWDPSPISDVNGVATFQSNLASLTGSVDGTIDYGIHSCTSTALFNYEILDIPNVSLAVDRTVLCGPEETVTATTGMDPADYSFEWFVNSFPVDDESSTCEDISGYNFLGEIDDCCYYEYETTTTWTDATNLAASIGGQLVDITSQAEADDLNTLLGNNNTGGNQHWIGLIDGNSVWESGEPLVFTNYDGSYIPGEHPYMFLQNNGFWDNSDNIGSQSNDLIYPLIEICGSSNNSLTTTFTYPNNAGLNDIFCLVTGDNGCDNGSVIIVEMLEGAELNLAAPAICEGEPFYIETTTNGNITWGANGAIPYSDGYYYDPATDGTIYTATAVVTSASVILAEQYDCEAEASVVVDTRPSPDLDFVFSGVPCTGENVQVDVIGAENYSWVSNPNEIGSSVNSDGSNPGFNILSLGYTDIIPGDLTVDATGSIEYTDGTGLTCSTTETFTNTINANTSFQIIGDTEICEGECINLSVQFDDNPNGAVFTYNWLLDGNPHSNLDTFTECPTYQSGVAEITLIVEAGSASCQSSQTIFVNTSQIPIVTATANVNEGCTPLTVNFTATNQFAGITAWNFDNGSSDTGVDVAQMTFDCLDYNTGDCTYDVSYTAISSTNPNCTTTEIVPITVHPIPVSAFYLQDTIVCYEEGIDVVINAVNSSSEIIGQNCTAGTTPYNWTLFPSGSGTCTETVDEVPLLTTSNTGNFTVGLELTDQYGCTSQSFEDFLVAEAPTPELAFFQTSVCLPTQVEILNTTTGAASFELEIPGFTIPTNFNSPFFLNVEYPGYYEAEYTVTSPEGCSIELDIDPAFEAWNPPVADFTTDPEYIDILEPIVNFVNLTDGGTEFIWSFGDGDGSSEVNPSHEYYAADDYQVQLYVTNQYGCTDVSTQTISVNNLIQIFVPNSFTPNNDGNNDAWWPVISGKELIAQYELWIYNRWGNLVFFSNTPEEPWVGENTISGAGEHYATGTEAFTWIIEIKMVDGLGARKESGHVYLVR